MPNIQWDVPMEIISPYLPGGLLLNQPMEISGRDNWFFFLVKPENYAIVPGKFRSVIDSISQADGVSIQPPYIDGLIATMKVEYWVAPRGDVSALTIACTTEDHDFRDDARVMNEMLVGVLNSLRVWTTDPNNMQRYIWTPTGAVNQRLLTNVILASWPQPAQDPPLVSQSFSLGSPFPYAIDIHENDPVIADGDSMVITNDGNAAQSPVMEVAGPVTVFTIMNTDTGQEISYDGSRPPAMGAIASGHHAEIDFFQGSIFLDGDGADLIGYLDPTVTDLFTLAPGDQTIQVIGADVTVKYNDGAWV